MIIELLDDSAQMSVEDAADCGDVVLREDYSGRGMYGESCFGVVGNLTGFAQFLVSLAETEPCLAYKLARAAREDGMGIDRIYYFPGFAWEKGD